MTDPYNVHRFVAAQNPVFDRVLRELESGQKQTHWMWFVFPQIKGLGHSTTANYYAIASAHEARAYLAHPVLGPRLEQCTRLVNSLAGTTAEDIFGPVDALKFRSSMTLFAAIAHSEAILAAVNLGDDADTTAAICGQVAGAYYGLDAIPANWQKQLALYDEIRELADALYDNANTKVTSSSGSRSASQSLSTS